MSGLCTSQSNITGYYVTVLTESQLFITNIELGLGRVRWRSGEVALVRLEGRCSRARLRHAESGQGEASACWESEQALGCYFKCTHREKLLRQATTRRRCCHNNLSADSRFVILMQVCGIFFLKRYWGDSIVCNASSADHASMSAMVFESIRRLSPVSE